ncbi:response regulator transcription factor [Chloroflexi bacterium TSY]|nr:response regulator transcription factor [Chloroflexi bacterium TSY]
MHQFKILLVEDDPKTVRMIRLYLEQENFVVQIAVDGPSGETSCLTNEPDLVLLDLMLPGFDGFELCRRIRRETKIPILMLTARTTDIDKAKGLGIGADDYLTKPFNPIELIARVKALLRRTYEYNESNKSDSKQSTQLGGPRVLLNPTSRVVTIDGHLCELTRTEFDLLHLLMAESGRAVSRNQLLATIWGYQDEAAEDTLTVHISNLRQKLGEDGARLIRTIRGVGYLYTEHKEST